MLRGLSAQIPRLPGSSDRLVGTLTSCVGVVKFAENERHSDLTRNGCRTYANHVDLADSEMHEMRSLLACCGHDHDPI